MVKPAYVDSSVLVKHYILSEIESSHASRIIKDYQVYVSSIGRIEVISAFSRKFQLGEATVEEIDNLKGYFLSDCDRLGIVELREDVISEAQKLVFRVRLKALDSIHLASAIVLSGITDLAFPFITADKQLASAAENEGFKVIRLGI